MWDTVWSALTLHAGPLGALAAVLAILAFIFSIFRAVAWLWRKSEQVEIVNLPPAPKGQLTVAEFLQIRREMRADLLAELATADPAEAVILRHRVEELERQIADPDPALAAALAEIANLKEKLEREANQIGAGRLRAAEEAMDRLDFSLADALFAEVEERQRLEIQTAARAAFGRGEIAEAEIRWADAATHYARAAQLDPSFNTLFYATHFTQLTGEYSRAERLALECLALARAGDDPTDLSRALDNYATVLQRLGRYAEAEKIFTQALEIERATVGEGHPDYAVQLNNLAGTVWAQGRFAEAERLYREALNICRATIGERHPNYATHLNNLAGVVRAQGRYSEAERLYRQALEIDRASIGEGHPDYAIDLNNLAGVLVKLDRPDDARPLYEQALGIFRATLPPDHPHIQKVEEHLSKLP